MILTIKLLLAISWMTLFLMTIFVLAWGVVEYGKRQLKLEQEYEQKYARISRILNNNNYPPDERDYDWIMRLFEDLNKLKWHNKEKTKVLYDSFVLKYSKIIMVNEIKEVYDLINSDAEKEQPIKQYNTDTV